MSDKSKAKRGRPKKVYKPTFIVWREFGGRLLKRIRNRRKLAAKLEGLLTDIEEPKLLTKTLDELNSLHSELGDDWYKWVDAVKQVNKDKYRTRITISNSCKETIIDYIGSKEWGISRGVEELINTLRDIGISSLDELLTIHDDLQRAIDYVEDVNDVNDELKKEISDLKETIAALEQELEEYEN